MPCTFRGGNFCVWRRPAVALPMTSRIAIAQSYPSRPVRIVVPFAAGGGSDIVARLLGQWLSERLGQPFIVENRPGAGGTIGTDVVVRAPADGHTLLQIGTFNVINAAVYEKLGFDFARDIAPVAGIIRVPGVMLVNPTFSTRSVPEFIAYAKTHPGKITMASGGTGGFSHAFGELFKMRAGVELLHVPYRGVGPALTDLLGGQVQVMFDTLPQSIEHVKIREASCTCSNHRNAGAVVAAHPDRQRICAGIRSDRLPRDRRSEEHNRGNRWTAQQGDQCGSC